MISFQWYNGNIKDSKPRGFLTIEQFINSHKKPSEGIKKAFDEIEEAAAAGDKKRKSFLKQTKLFYFTPSVIFTKNGVERENNLGRKYTSFRCYDNIESYTGLAQIDIDNLEPEEAIDLKAYLFENYEEFYCVYLSPSRRGVKGIIQIPIVKSVSEFKEFYKGIEDEMNWIAGFDSAPKNLALPLFISYDEDILYRDNPTTWSKKGVLQSQDLSNLKSEKPKIKYAKGGENTYRSQEYFKKITLDIFSNKMDGITDSGHPQLRAACLVLGSRSGAGYLTAGEAMLQAEYSIRTNKYLQKGISGYIKTAEWAINQGYSKPKYYQ
jgi:hypothetical protein